MSDTVSEASRAQAREWVAHRVLPFVPGYSWAGEAADAILDPETFERLAALLGFVRAGEVEHAWRRNDVIYPEDWVADGPPPGFELVRRTVGYGPWEKATNAES